MAQLDAAADSLVAFCEKLKPLSDVADALKGLGSVENAIVERKAGLVAATAAHEAALAKIEEAKADLANIASTKAIDMAAHMARLDAMALKAKSDAKAMLDSATATAAATVSDAEARVRSIEDNHATVMAKAQADLTATNQSLAAANTALTAVHAEHDAVSAKITALKAAAASVLA